MYCDKIAESIAEYRSELSAFVTVAQIYYIEMKLDNSMKSFERVLGAINNIEKSAFFISVQLKSKRDNLEYENINEMHSLLEGVEKASCYITNLVRNGGIENMEEDIFEEKISAINSEMDRLYEETIDLLTNNKNS